jgi:cytochrome c-type biogenesis protein CcmH/NrfG
MKTILAILLIVTAALPGLAADVIPHGDDINQVQASYEKALSQDPHNRDALYMLGLIYEKKQQKQDALQAWRNYLSAETDPAKREMAAKHIHQLSQ